MTGHTDARQVEGEAGYLSPYPYLDRLQEKMEERLARRVPVKGRFCGFCYGRLRDSDAVCGFCGSRMEAVGTVDEIPQPVLRLYKRKQQTEARWVYGLGFVGLIIASVLFILMAIWGPNIPARIGVAFAILIGGGYVLAQIFGTIIGGQIGYRRGARRRDGAWARYLAERDG
jgi:hypothetical protein